VIFCGSELPDGSFREVVQEAHRAWKVPVVVASRSGGWEEYCKTMQHGGFDLVATPCRADEVRRILSQVPRNLSAA
jgi:DNA-binding NtrC family response regulator